ncbi:MAG: GNAT family N-acetyltransferase [Desulfobacteraceae bacterium]|nr:GNAT family N-acetyltransferase [Desulfobacteraceae bacterium]
MTAGDAIRIEIVDKADPLDIIALYKDAGWWKGEYDTDTGFLAPLVQNSACFAGAFHGKTMVGMGRAISDQVSDAYIQDVVVLKPFRKKGIGRRMVQEIIRHLQQKGVDWIGLVGTPGTRKFYESMGFEPMEEHIPFVYRGE